MTGALLGFCAAAVSMKGLAPRFDPFEANLIRNTGGLLCVLAYMALAGDKPRALDRKNVAAHLVRNAFHWAGVLCWTVSVTVLPLATVFSLEFTTPIWVAVIAAVFLGRSIPPACAAGLAIGFGGVLLVVSPSPGSFDSRTVFPLATAVFFALAVIMTKSLTRRNTVANVLFWMMATQMLANAIGVCLSAGPAAFVTKLRQEGSDLWLLPLLVLGGLVSQLCLTKALESGNEVVVMTLDFLRLPLISVLGFLLFGETVGANTLVGGVAVLAAVTIVSVWGKPSEAGPAKTRKPLLA